MDLDELLDCSQALAMQPPMYGENVIVITNGGGIGVLSSDSAEFHGIPLKTAPADLQAAFYKCMPSYGSPKNPVDITGGTGAKGYEDAIEIALQSDWVGAIAVLYCQSSMTVPIIIAESVCKIVAKFPGNKKPVACCFVGGEECNDAAKKLGESSIPSYDTPKKTMCALSTLRQLAKFNL